MEARMAYKTLSDEDKIELSIQFVASQQPLPEELAEWLRDNGLYDLITKPGLSIGFPE
ncbi:hypothetical protein ZHAWSFBX_CDS_0049 [Agrobacterium phage Alfirin]|nr:hypothetical protein ZHAWSFBX_CDS_0049 [Agrobacterium phage Alfirin]